MLESKSSRTNQEKVRFFDPAAMPTTSKPGPRFATVAGTETVTRRWARLTWAVPEESTVPIGHFYMT